MPTLSKAHRTLRNLLETCEDSRKAFHAGASAVEEEQLSDQLTVWAKEREHFCTQLRNLMTMLNANPIGIHFEAGSVTGLLERASMKLSASASSRDTLAILGACYTGEARSREVYEKAVEIGWPEEISIVIQKQFSAVVRTHVGLAELRNRAEA